MCLHRQRDRRCSLRPDQTALARHMNVFRFSNCVFAAWISPDVLNEFVNRPVEMNPTASGACSRVKHLLEV